MNKGVGGQKYEFQIWYTPLGLHQVVHEIVLMNTMIDVNIKDKESIK